MARLTRRSGRARRYKLAQHAARLQGKRLSADRPPHFEAQCKQKRLLRKEKKIARRA
jgi:hypothetical protein